MCQIHPQDSCHLWSTITNASYSSVGVVLYEDLETVLYAISF